MPKVKGKHFAYTPAGRKAAAAESKKTGSPVTNKKQRRK